MTAKELRRQAGYIVEQWDNHDKFRMVEGDEAFMNADGEPDAVTFSRHILSTVRDDDDEPLDSTFLLSVGATTMNNKDYWVDSAWGVSLICGAWISMDTDTKVKTRGQFRSLCKGLGIVLEEKADAD